MKSLISKAHTATGFRCWEIFRLSFSFLTVKSAEVDSFHKKQKLINKTSSDYLSANTMPCFKF